MSWCKCDAPTDYRATGEDTGEDYLYLRCARCGGKVERVDIDKEDLLTAVTNPDDADKRVSIHFDVGDSPWVFKNEVLGE